MFWNAGTVHGKSWIFWKSDSEPSQAAFSLVSFCSTMEGRPFANAIWSPRMWSRPLWAGHTLVLALRSPWGLLPLLFLCRSLTRMREIASGPSCSLFAKVKSLIRLKTEFILELLTSRLCLGGHVEGRASMHGSLRQKLFLPGGHLESAKA